MIEDTEELETESVDTPETGEDEGFLPQPGDEADTDEVDAEDEDGEEEEGEEEAPLIEVERGGKTYKIPAELKDEFLMQGDYTRKTQEIAEQRKQYEAAIQRVSEVSEAETQALYKVAQIDVELAQYQNVDWDAWFEQDPIAADRAERRIEKLQRAREGATGEHARAREIAAQITQQETAKRVEEGARIVKQMIPDWGPEKDAKLTAFALAQGFEPDELRGAVANPRMIVILNAAYEHMENQKKAAVAKKIEKQVEIKPAAKIKGKAGSVKTGLHDGLSTAEWIRRDRARAAQRR